MKRPVLNLTNLLATAASSFVGCVFFASLPDLRRYIRISTTQAVVGGRSPDLLADRFPQVVAHAIS